MCIKDTEEIKNFSKFKNEVDSYLYYRKLLEFKRSDEALREIHQVLKQTKNITLRINEIERIDREDKQKNPDFYSDDKKTKSKLVTLIEDEKLNKTKSKYKLHETKFLRFIFSYRKDLKSYSKKTLLLIPKFFGFYYKISPVLFSSLELIYNQILKYVYKPLKFTVETGWQQLDKKQYNLVFRLFKLIEEFIVFGNDKSNSSKRVLFSYLREIAKLYLDLIYEKSNLDTLVTSIKIVLSPNINYKRFVPKMLEFIYHLFDISINTRNFGQILTAVFNMHYRKIISFEELFAHYGTKAISSESYVTNNKIAAKIKQRISQIEENLDDIERELFNIKLIVNELKINKITDQNFREIVLRVINKAPSFNKKEHDEQFYLEYFFSDIIRSLHVITSGFIEYYKEILIGNVELKYDEEKVENVRIFDPKLFKRDISDFNDFFDQIDKLEKHIPRINISYSIYKEFKNKKKLDNQKDKERINLILSGAKLYNTIALKLNNYLYNHFLSLSKVNEDPIKYHQSKNKTIDFFETDPRLIPYYNETVKDEKATIIDTLQDIVFIAINMANILELQKVDELLMSKEHLIEEAEELLIEKARYI